MAVCVKCGKDVQPGDIVREGYGVDTLFFCGQEHRIAYLAAEESGKGQVKHAKVEVEVTAEVPKGEDIKVEITEGEEEAPPAPKRSTARRKRKTSSK